MLCTVKYADNCPEVKMVWGQSLGFLTARQVRSCRLDRCEKWLLFSHPAEPLYLFMLGKALDLA